MRSAAQNEALMDEVRALLKQAEQHERGGSPSIADVFGRAAAGALARHLNWARKQDALDRSPLVRANRELSEGFMRNPNIH